MNAQQRREQLRTMMSEYSVSIEEVAKILDRSHGTIRNWRSDLGETLAPPKNELRLLKFELEARKAQNEKTPADANS